MLCARLEPVSGIGNKAIIISAKQQSHTEEYGVVHGSSNHTRKNTKEYDVELAKQRFQGQRQRKGNPAGSVYVCF